MGKNFISYLNPINVIHKIEGKYKRHKLMNSFKCIGSLEVDIHRQRILTPKLIEIGQEVFLGEDIYISAEVSMGDRVMFGPRCTIIGGDHIFERMGEYPRNIKPINRENSKKIILEEDIWVGLGVTILKGVTIGKGAVIGAGSLVVNDIPPYTVAVGNPCKVVRKIFDDYDLNKHLAILGYDKLEIDKTIEERSSYFQEDKDKLVIVYE